MTTKQFMVAFAAIVNSSDDVFLRRLRQACDVRLSLLREARETDKEALTSAIK